MFDSETGDEISREDYEAMMADLGPVSVADYPTNDELEAMAAAQGIDLPF